MEGFFKPSEQTDVPVTSSKKKRKIEDKKDDTDELKQTAKLYCKCSEQWKIISKYNTDKLKAWIDEKEFDQTKQLHDTVFSFLQKAIGFGLDTMTRGEDYVNKEILDDVSLRQAIEIEAANWVSYLSNRFRILALIGIDVSNGKLKQNQENKSMVTIIENGGRDDEPEPVMASAENEAQGSGEVPGNR